MGRCRRGSCGWFRSRRYRNRRRITVARCRRQRCTRHGSVGGAAALESFDALQQRRGGRIEFWPGQPNERHFEGESSVERFALIDQCFAQHLHGAAFTFFYINSCNFKTKCSIFYDCTVR